jgi:hypothetical protein
LILQKKFIKITYNYSTAQQKIMHHIKIKYEASKFPPAALSPSDAKGYLEIQWTDLVWAAITTGKRNASYWKSHPCQSLAEAVSRAWYLYAHLKTNKAGELEKSKLYDSMDPTEKVGASYFLGMTFAKLASEVLLDTPWLFHVSLATEIISYAPGKSRPDFLGQTKSLDWIVLEAKGRSGIFSSSALEKAKAQSKMISTINGSTPICRAGIQTYFDPNICIKMEDPPSSKNAQPINIDMEQALSTYYSIRSTIRRSGEQRKIEGIDYLVLTESNTGLTIGLPEFITNPNTPLKPEILSQQGRLPPKSVEINQKNKLFRDGFYIELNDLWSTTQMEIDPEVRNGSIES